MEIKKYANLDTLQSFFNNLKGLFATKSEVDKKADVNHVHTITDVTNLQSTLDEKADSVHTHNDIYYTKTEIDEYSFITTDDIDAICGGTS